jgi:N-succinyldiaminopimelate aminotransferase
MKQLSNTVLKFKESIFASISKEALAHNAVNLGQGFPDFDGPSWIIDLAQKALAQGRNQYAPFPGLLELRQAIAETSKNYHGTNYQADNEVTVTNGATEAIFCTSLALLNPGDEVIVFEPFYDSYIASIELAGARAIPVTLKAPSFTFDHSELAAAFNEKTKMVFINTPHNPTGKVFSRIELETIATLAKKWDCYVLADEVYEFLTYDGVEHISIATLPDMRERTVTISSTGKTFGLTGWKIGWTCAPAPLTHAIRMVHQFTVFSVHGPAQIAMALALSRLGEYLPTFRKDYLDKRDFFLKGMRDIGFEPLTPAGTYFSLCPVAPGETDITYCQKLIREKKVATIPPSAFYSKSKEGEKFVRFCFAKKEETLKAALKNLQS